MSIDLDYTYANILSSRLPRFKLKKTQPYLANFRCVLCGDSEKKSTKARGYIYQKEGKDTLTYHCHNCGFHKPLGFFVQKYDPLLYNEYCFELFKNNPNITTKPKQELSSIKKDVVNIPLDGLVKISKLSHLHPAKQYVVNRLIPPETHYKLFFTPHFTKWVNSVSPGKLPAAGEKFKSDPRLVIPLVDKDGNVFGVQGRDVTGKPNKIRYITVMFDSNQLKVYGLDSVNPNYKTYILEGPIDSLFIKNSLAMAGSDISFNALQNVAHLIKENTIYVFDNEPRNKEICTRMERIINDDFNICIWPSNVTQKDVNKMVEDGLDPQKIIERRTFRGLFAKMEFANWRKDI